jgi:hypothetical protein
MNSWRLRLAVLALTFLGTVIFGSPAQSTNPKLKPVVRQVDHILIESSDPPPLFQFFAETLQLPVAWPLADYNAFISGGVNAGNVNIEVLRYAGPEDSPTAGRGRAHFIGLALEPYQLTDCLSALQTRGIPHDPPEPYTSKLPDGSMGTLWTNVVLPRLSKPALSVFLCEYSPAFLQAEIRRNQLGGQLALRKGGPLGIKAVMEIVIGTRDPARDRNEWQNLLVTASAPSKMLWQCGSGPLIHLVPGTSDRIQRVILRVDSLKSAGDFLAGKHRLGSASSEEISIDLSGIQGLSIRLVEK